MTVLSLLREVGEACLRFHDALVRGLETVTLQCDEVWSFCYSKEKNVPAALKGQPNTPAMAAGLTTYTLDSE